MGNISWSIKPTKDWQCVWQLDQTLTKSSSLSKPKNDAAGQRLQTPVGTRHTCLLELSFSPLCPHCTVSREAGATSSWRAVHPVCGSTAITDFQSTAKHCKEDVWWQESSSGHVRIPGASLSTHHRCTNVLWCPATWTVLLKRVGIFMYSTLDLHFITLIIRAKFPSRSEAWSLRTAWLFSMHHFRISHTKWNELL